MGSGTGKTNRRGRDAVALVTVVGALSIVWLVRPGAFDGWLLLVLVGVLLVVLGLALCRARRWSRGRAGESDDVVLAELRERLRVQGDLRALADGWRGQTELATAGGVNFAGDFVIANVSADRSQLEVVLVDVSGKGIQVATYALHFAGALGGMLGELPPPRLFAAANDFLLRQGWPEGFATAIHVTVDLVSGEYSVTNAGHPPLMRWHHAQGRWELDDAHGMALGVAEQVQFVESCGRLGHGDALLMYTDGMIELPGQDLTDGIAWLQSGATGLAAGGFDRYAARLLATARRDDDDRAVVVIDRTVPI